MRDDDAIRNDGELPDLVKVNDVFFALHALTLTSITLLQIYWFGNRGSISPIVRTGLYVVLLCLVLAGFETLARNVVWDNDASYLSHNIWTWLGFCILTSFVKLGITVIKYVPQSVLNYQRKSTEGWSICNILLDFSGGLLSFAQLVVDAVDNGNLSLVIDNPVKLGLSFFSIGFDILFMVQHYWLYPQGSDVYRDEESEAAQRLN